MSDDHAHEAPQGENVILSANNDEFIASVEQGLQPDSMDYKKIFFWNVMGIITVIVLIIFAVEFQQHSTMEFQRSVANNAEYIDISNLRNAQTEKLNSFGLNDAENGVYHIPIEVAIEKMTEQ